MSWCRQARTNTLTHARSHAKCERSIIMKQMKLVWTKFGNKIFHIIAHWPNIQRTISFSASQWHFCVCCVRFGPVHYGLWSFSVHPSVHPSTRPFVCFRLSVCPSARPSWYSSHYEWPHTASSSRFTFYACARAHSLYGWMAGRREWDYCGVTVNRLCSSAFSNEGERKISTICFVRFRGSYYRW